MWKYQINIIKKISIKTEGNIFLDYLKGIVGRMCCIFFNLCAAVAMAMLSQPDEVQGLVLYRPDQDLQTYSMEDERVKRDLNDNKIKDGSNDGQTYTADNLIYTDTGNKNPLFERKTRRHRKNFKKASTPTTDPVSSTSGAT